MKGIELLATIISFLVFLGITIIFSGIIISVVNTVQATKPIVRITPYRLALSPLYPPIDYEDMLLSYLETTDPYSGFQIKKLIVYAAYQKNVTNVFINGDEVTSLPLASAEIFSRWIENYGYMLILNNGGEPYILVNNKLAFEILPDRMLKVRRVSIPSYIDSESVAGKKRELPLNVTLDLYVQ